MKKRKAVLVIVVSAILFLGSMNASAHYFNYTKTQYPIILVPGVTGFDALFGVVDYWYGMADMLRLRGATVHDVALTGWNGVYEGDIMEGHDAEGLRGPELEDIILGLMARHGYEKVNIISHSHGTTTSRYFLNRHPDKVASLTTIAGPHKGVPAADQGWENVSSGVQSVLVGGIDFLMGDVIAFLCGNWDLIGTQDTWQTVNHFRTEGIKRFNRDFPCPALPYSIDENGEKIYHEGIAGLYGEKCDFEGDTSATMTFQDPDTGETRSGYVHFFSWTGNIGTGGILNGATNLDVVDPFMVVTNVFNQAYGYYGDADAFIPVASAQFGDVLCDTYYWNHCDEINHTMGLRAPFSPSPITVICNHANRLKNMDL